MTAVSGSAPRGSVAMRRVPDLRRQAMAVAQPLARDQRGRARADTFACR